MIRQEASRLHDILDTEASRRVHNWSERRLHFASSPNIPSLLQIHKTLAAWVVALKGPVWICKAFGKAEGYPLSVRPNDDGRRL